MARDLWKTRLDVSPWLGPLTEAFDVYWRTYVDPDTGVVYDSPNDPAAMAKADHEVQAFRHTASEAFPIPEEYARPDLGAWPTPEEIAASVPCVNGWFTPIENAASRGAMLLAGLVRGAFDLTPERRSQCVDLLFKGLIALWDVPGRTGFVCRGFLPRSRAFYKQTSHDQVPLYLIGLAAFRDSEYCSDDQRALVADVFESVMSWLEAGEWVIRLHDGERQTPHNRLADSNDPGHNAKVFALLLLAHQVTGNAHWREVYLAWRDENARKRFGYLARRDKTWAIYDPWQISVMYRILARHDDHPECRAFYDEQRRLFMHTLAYFCRHPLPPHVPLPLDAPAHEPRRLPDWRPGWLRAARESGFEPNRSVFWYQVAACLDELTPGARSHAGLISTYAWVLAAYRLIMADWPEDRPSWGAENIRERLEQVLARLDPRLPLSNVHVLAFALGD